MFYHDVLLTVKLPQSMDIQGVGIYQIYFALGYKPSFYENKVESEILTLADLVQYPARLMVIYISAPVTKHY